ncbi:hypothetical protein FBU59_002914 [Linderina macrospora]|uniref:Uncharacterized protein n=1 Tax=Linderina macrospora TaxID=4868 RepID=A0ACC1J9Y7_9FUNG|nr:hypothetical protein FBU59_002914 [Linderina macrospora]
MVCLPERSPTASLSIPSIASLAPAYRGEVFPVEVAVKNLHKTVPLTRVLVGVQLVNVTVVARDDSMSDLNVDNAAAAVEGPVGVLNPTEAVAALKSPVGAVDQGTDVAAWIVGQDATCAENHDSGTQDLKSTIEISAMTPIPPSESQTTTVYVKFPAPLLSNAWRLSPATAVQVKCIAKYTHDGSTTSDNGGVWWESQVSAQATIPVTRPLRAVAEALPAHIAAPLVVPEQQRAAQAFRVSTEATEMFGTGEYCFRRPVLVTLQNTGPWPVAVKHMVLRPPLTDDRVPWRIQVSSATTAMVTEDGSAWQMAENGQIKHVFWLDIFTSNVLQMPTEICPGTLEVTWHRSGAGDFAPILTRLWLKPLELAMARQVQVESVCSMDVAKVGSPMQVDYRLLNPTRALKTLEISMHAADGFVFSGPRRSTMNILPGHVAAAAKTTATGAGTPVAPPPTQIRGRGVNTPRSDVIDSDATARAALLQLSGLDDGELTSGRVSPGLLDECLMAVPECFYAEDGEESDFEDAGDGDLQAGDYNFAMHEGDGVLRLDQTTIFCQP